MYKLRELEVRDIPTINKWRNDPELIKLLGAPFRYVNTSTDLNWFENYLKSRSNVVRCAIVDPKEDDILGLISLVSIDHLNQCAELHIMIGETINQGKGIGTFAVKEMLNHAFDNLNLQRIELTVMAHNSRAIHLYEKIGFVREGIMRRSRYKNGRFVDVLMYSILKNEFNK